MGKTNAEHCKNYYNRKKAAKEAEKIRQGLSVEKPIKKTGAERTRAYRLRKKMLSQANESSVTDISSIPSTSNSRIRAFEPSFQLVTTSASTNRPDVSTVSSTGIADHDGDNLHDSFLSTSTHDNRNSITVQAEIQSERLRSPEYVNYYDSNTDLLTQLKKELSVEENLETSCSFGSDLFFEDEKILEAKNIITNESKNNNTDERLTLNGIIKHEKEYHDIIKTEKLEERVESDNRYCVTVKTEELESQEELDNRYCVTVKTEELKSQEELDNKGYVRINTQKLADQEGLDNVRSSSVHYSVLVTPKRVQCKWCGRPFENSFNLLKHNTEHLKLDINIPNHIKKERRKRVKTKKMIKTNESFHCNYCDKVFKQIRDRKIHTRIVHSKEKYYCDLCGKRFKCLQYIRTHMQSIHLPVMRANNLKCQFCGVVLKHKYNLHCHIKTVHNNETFKCDTCDAVFKCKQYLMLHCKRMHYKYGKMFPCEWCDKEFRTPLHLHDHTKRVHIDLVKKLKAGVVDKKN